jgi:hypothetical protein
VRKPPGPLKGEEEEKDPLPAFAGTPPGGGEAL